MANIVHTEIRESIDRLVENRNIRALFKTWETLRNNDPERLPSYDRFAPSHEPGMSDQLMVLVPGGDDFHYRFYGRGIATQAGFDMTGKSTADFDSEVGRWFQSKYRDALALGRPIYTAHNALHASAIVSWERLILPVEGPEGAPWIVCYNEPLDSKSDLYDGILAASLDGIALFRPRFEKDRLVDLDIVAVNRSAVEIVGRPEAELVGHSLREIVPDLKGFEVYERVWTTGKGERFESEQPMLGKTLNVSVGRAAGKLIVTFADITEIREAQAQLEHQHNELLYTNETLREQAGMLVDLAEDKSRAESEARRAGRFVEQLLEAVPLPLFYRLRDGCLGLVNSSYAALYGRMPDEITGHPLAELLPRDLVARIDAMDETLYSAPDTVQTYETDLSFPHAQDRRFVMNKAAIRGDTDAVTGVLGTLVDVTERHHLAQELERLATTDPLTGLFNRRVLLSRASEMVERVRRYDREASIVMLDIDHFKAINDELGHDIGDQVLIRLAEVVRGTLRKAGDLVARVGGEEFAILLPETGIKGAMVLAERLRVAIEESEVATPAGPRRITASFGVATINGGDTSVDTAMKRADEALYQAKEAGRNRVTRAAA
ncbi:MAG: diguanylate cyclase [Alphaproteobacteria bacterium]|nr:diguanylate cyclase [Alphaproteobacteria bacterium]